MGLKYVMLTPAANNCQIHPPTTRRGPKICHVNTCKIRHVIMYNSEESHSPMYSKIGIKYVMLKRINKNTQIHLCATRMMRDICCVTT